MKMKFHFSFAFFDEFLRFFGEILMKINRNFTAIVRKRQNVLRFCGKVRQIFGKCWKFPEFVRKFHFSFHFFIRVRSPFISILGGGHARDGQREEHVERREGLGRVGLRQNVAVADRGHLDFWGTPKSMKHS